MNRKTKKIATSMSFSPALLSRVDEARGDVSRTRWIERAIVARLSYHVVDTAPDWSEGLPKPLYSEEEVTPRFKETKKRHAPKPKEDSE